MSWFQLVQLILIVNLVLFNCLLIVLSMSGLHYLGIWLIIGLISSLGFHTDTLRAAGYYIPALKFKLKMSHILEFGGIYWYLNLLYDTINNYYHTLFYVRHSSALMDMNILLMRSYSIIISTLNVFVVTKIYWLWFVN